VLLAFAATFVLWFVMVTEAFGTAAPEGSVMVPEMAPAVVFWAQEGTLAEAHKAIAPMARQIVRRGDVRWLNAWRRFMFSPPQE
jgi:hypothetical protein